MYSCIFWHTFLPPLQIRECAHVLHTLTHTQSRKKITLDENRPLILQIGKLRPRTLALLKTGSTTHSKQGALNSCSVAVESEEEKHISLRVQFFPVSFSGAISVPIQYMYNAASRSIPARLRGHSLAAAAGPPSAADSMDSSAQKPDGNKLF